MGERAFDFEKCLAYTTYVIAFAVKAGMPADYVKIRRQGQALPSFRRSLYLSCTTCPDSWKKMHVRLVIHEPTFVIVL